LPLLAVIALGALGTGLAFMFQYDVVRAAGPVVGSTITYLIPIVSVLLGTLVLGEHLSWSAVAGFVVVLGAALVINAPERRAESEPVASA
jgi:drug/metabolite transporter (DMT)-like permease